MLLGREVVSRTFLTIGAFAALLAVALGAFGAHSLRGVLTPAQLEVYQTGVQYQMYHALALLLVALLAERHLAPARVRIVGWLFTAGMLFFSGSLYALALSGVRVLGAITPLGGVCFLAGWLTLALSARQGGTVRENRYDDTDA